jgi:hypothetical protein
MDFTSGPDNDTTKSPTSPDVLSKSTKMSQSKSKLADSGSHQATSGPTLQGRSSYAPIARKAVSNEPLGSASPGAALSRPSQTRAARHADNQSTVDPAGVSMDRQATARRANISKFDVEVHTQSRAGQVSPRVSVVLQLRLRSSPMTLYYSILLMRTSHETLLSSLYLPISPLIYLL